MNKIYTIDSNCIFSGIFDVQDIYAPVPVGVDVAPPELTGTEVAKWNNGEWCILTEYPAASAFAMQVPQQVSMRQARLALLDVGLLDDVEAIITAAGRAAQIEWEYAATVDRNHPVIAIVQQQQGMTDSQIDALFTSAAAL